jgi:hypothetical protein
MSIFTKTGYGLKYCITHPHEVIMHKIRDIHCAWQRATKGYCYRDIWSIDYWFLKTIPNMIDSLKKVHHGYPNGLSDEEWCEILSKISRSFRNADDECTDYVNPYKDEYLSKLHIDIETSRFICDADEELEKKYLETENKRNQYMNDNLKEGFALFQKYFHSLWD